MASRIVVATRTERHPLLIMDDAALLDDLIGLATRAGTQVDVAPDAEAARHKYTAAPCVIVATEAAFACASAGFPQRSGVVVVDRCGQRDPADGGADGLHWRAAQAIGAEHVALLPAAGPWLADRLTQTTAQQPGGSAPGAPDLPGKVVAVLGGRGGAGASVLAAGLAVTGARAGLRALLIDADPLGGGVDLVLGWEGLDGLRWPALAQTSGAVHPPALVRALPNKGDLAVLSWDRQSQLSVPTDAMETALDAGRRDRQLVVVDLPRRLDPAATLALSAADLALLVVPAELRACAAAARVAGCATGLSEAMAVVVRLPAPGRLRTREISRALGLPVIGTLRPEPGIARGLERGEPPAGTGRGPLAALSGRVLAELGLIERIAA